MGVAMIMFGGKVDIEKLAISSSLFGRKHIDGNLVNVLGHMIYSLAVRKLLWEDRV